MKAPQKAPAKKKTTSTASSQSEKAADQKGDAKIAEVMHEFKEGELHSGSPDGPIVTNPKQAIAIALS